MTNTMISLQIIPIKGKILSESHFFWEKRIDSTTAHCGKWTVEWGLSQVCGGRSSKFPLGISKPKGHNSRSNIIMSEKNISFYVRAGFPALNWRRYNVGETGWEARGMKKAAEPIDSFSCKNANIVRICQIHTQREFYIFKLCR